VTEPGAPERRPQPPKDAQLPDTGEQAPAGTLVLMLIFLAAIAGLWILVYRLLLER
jgi:LPXTG-motif cell wall-anchored protein